MGRRHAAGGSATVRAGAELSRWPPAVNLRGLSIAEGVRAALACAPLILANEWLDWPPLIYAALAANLACSCDAGGAVRYRVLGVSAFAVLGALVWSGFGLMRPLGPAVLMPMAALLVFCDSGARIWGPGPQAVGNLLTVVLALALDRPLGWGQAAVAGGMFMAGGLWAAVLTGVIMRLNLHEPARVALAAVWRALADLGGDLQATQHQVVGRHRAGGAADAIGEAWSSHARVHRRAVREALETARAAVLAVVRLRATVTGRGADAVLRLETAEQLFGALIALSDRLEAVAEEGSGPRVRARVLALRRLRALLAVLAEAMARPFIGTPGAAMTPSQRRRFDPVRLERSIAALESVAAGDPLVSGLMTVLVARLRLAVRLLGSGDLAVPGQPAMPARPWRAVVLGPLRANLGWRSAGLRHAARVAVIFLPALALTLSRDGGYDHWLLITLGLTMQPYFAETWQRALERIAGTVVGGAVGAALAYVAHTPMQLAALMFPLCVVGFSARQVSYAAYIACITPQVVVLSDLLNPGRDSWQIAEMRVLFTVLGGLLAVAGSVLLWPSWEKGRLRQEMRRAIAAHARFVDAVAAALLAEGPAFGEEVAGGLEEARRRAGMATVNLEASLSRALQEPRGPRPVLEAALLVDGALRRMAGQLTALTHDPAARQAMGRAQWADWRVWMSGAMRALAQEREIQPDGTEGGGVPPQVWPDTAGRLARQVVLMRGGLARLPVDGV